MDEAGKEFLSISIADNAIAYTQDKASSSWTAGHYINNALYRLALIYDEHLNGVKTTYRDGKSKVNQRGLDRVFFPRSQLRKLHRATPLSLYRPHFDDSHHAEQLVPSNNLGNE